MSCGLYIARCNSLFERTEKDVQLWAGVYKMINTNVSLVDRCESVVMPYNFKLYEKFKMPRDLVGFTMSYEDCCQQRVEELVNLSRQLDKPIVIFYSGGIDSTTVVLSFMKYLSPTELKSRVKIAMTVDSIDENPKFYYDHIRQKCTLVSSERFGSMFDKNHIIVDGEHNDQLFGSDIMGAISRVSNDYFAKLHQPYSREFITGWMTRYMSPEEADTWFTVLDTHIKTQAPCEVSTNYHFWWWYNFCFKWQSVYFRMLNRIDYNLRPEINEEFLNNHYHHFFSSTNFQKWSMLNHSLKIGSNWTQYKLESKKLIYNYTKDKLYFDFKVKIGSLYRLFLQKKTAEGITDQFEFLETLDINKLYNPQNSFKDFI